MLFYEKASITNLQILSVNSIYIYVSGDVMGRQCPMKYFDLKELT